MKTSFKTHWYLKSLSFNFFLFLFSCYLFCLSLFMFGGSLHVYFTQFCFFPDMHYPLFTLYSLNFFFGLHFPWSYSYSFQWQTFCYTQRHPTKLYDPALTPPTATKNSSLPIKTHNKWHKQCPIHAHTVLQTQLFHGCPFLNTTQPHLALLASGDQLTILSLQMNEIRGKNQPQK